MALVRYPSVYKENRLGPQSGGREQNAQEVVLYYIMAVLLTQPLRCLKSSTYGQLLSLASCSFHTTAILAAGGPKNKDLKRKRTSKRPQEPPAHSNIRLSKLPGKKSSPDQLSRIDRNKKQSLGASDDNRHRSASQGQSFDRRRPQRASRIENDKVASKRDPSKESRRKGDVQSSGSSDITEGFTPGVDDFTASRPQSSRASRDNASKTTKRGSRLEKRPSVSREVLPHTESSVLANNVSHFSSVPLNTGLIESLSYNLGEKAVPSDIQRLALSHFFKRNPGLPDPSSIVQSSFFSSQTLLASQTGSGKSIAYLLPMLHSIKWRELAQKDEHPDAPMRPQWSPKGLVLAPTHELSRQLSRFAKGLCHNIKLRVYCLSQENSGNSPTGMGDMDFSHLPLVNGASEFELRRDEAAEGGKAGHGPQRPVDVMVGTAGRMLDLTRGRQWRDEMEKLMDRNPWERDEEKDDNSIGRLNPPGWKPSIDLSQVDWVVMDEADVVYGPDFVQTTEMLLNDIASAKLNKPLSTVGKGSPNPSSPYPFNLILCTATIPNSLDHYISTHYPSMERLTSVRLHQLPRSITPEHVPYSGGNRAADIASRIRKVWIEDGMERDGEKSKILLFCNKSSKVEGLAQYLNEHDIPAVPLVRVLERGKRKKNNDNSIESFLKLEETGARVRRKEAKASESSGSQPEPRVLVTTSLLSRGLDFSPVVKHVFIVDEPNNMVDFIHRAGRTGRAGQQGKVVIFSKSKGRGSARSMTGVRGEIMQKIGLHPTRHHFRRPADAFAS